MVWHHDGNGSSVLGVSHLIVALRMVDPTARMGVHLSQAFQVVRAKMRLNKNQKIACPKCAGKNNTIQLSVFSAPNGNGNGASAAPSAQGPSGGSCCGGGCH